jgi:two-component system sensor histidine kinase KdpD
MLLGREVTVNLPPDLPLVQVDQELIEKVFTNLLENVGAHTPQGTPLDILARNGSDRIYLEFADRGPGIPKGEEAAIFERFSRIQQGESQPGFGLGLAICRTVMKLHDGRVWAKNRDGGGAVFVIEILKSKNAPEVPVG